MIKKLIILAAFIFLPSTVMALEYYVKSGGSDSADGLSDENAWASLSKVHSTVTNGDTVYFRSQDKWQCTTNPCLNTTEGVTYDGSAYGSGTRAEFEMTSGGGTGDEVIRLDASNVTVRGFEVDMGGVNYSGISTYNASTDISNLTIDNCRVHNSLMGSSNWNYGIYLGGHLVNVDVSSVVVNDTDVYNVGHEAFALYPSNNESTSKSLSGVTITNCKAYNYGVDASDWSDGIYITNDASDIIVQDSEVYNTTSGFRGITISCKYSNTCPDNITIRRNIIHDVGYAGIVVSGHSTEQPGVLSGSYEIYNNILYGNNLAEITTGYYIDSSADVRFMNNSLYHSYDHGNTAAGAFRVFIIDASSGTPIYLYNNILWSDADPCLFTRYSNDTARLSHENNLYYRSGGASTWIKLSDGATEYSGSQIVSSWEATAQNTDPNFVNAAGDNYDIDSPSDAIDNGADLSGTFTTDYHGDTRDSLFDIGADEYGAGSFSPSSGITFNGVTIGQ
jgi:hypothetical protein